MVDRIVVVLHALLGAAFGASLLGFLEAVFHLFNQGAPDLWSPFYGVVLYGLIALPFGVAAGIAMLGIQRVRELGEWERPLAMTMGAVFAVTPLLLFILHYLGNKVVYAEQGVPLSGKLGILLIGGLYAIAELTVGTWAFKRGQFSAAKQGGMYGLLVVVAALLTLVPAGDPRSAWAHGKSVPAGMADNPNVLILTVDTLRADYLGTYGREGNPTPVIDALAADGVVFESASAHASWTRSSFASLWTSRLPTSHNADAKASQMNDELVLLSEALNDAGVTTANLANNINVTSTFNFDQGYDTFIYEAPAYHFGATESVFSLTFYKVVHKLREKFSGSKHVESFYQPAEVVLADAEGFITANGDARWMLGVHLMEPHDPYFEHPYLDGKSDLEFNGVGFARAEVEHPEMSQADYLKSVYLDEIRHLDNKLAPFIAWLKSEGHYDNTLIILTADHGEEFGEHGGFWHGTTLYEEQIHVPLIVKLPNQALKGERVPWQARLIDVAPTVTAMMGIEVDPEWKWAGRDLLGDVVSDVTLREAREKEREDARQLIDLLAETRDAGMLSPADEERLQEAEALLAQDEVAPDPCEAYEALGSRRVVAEQDFEGNVLSAVRAGGFKLIRANDGNPRGLPEVQLFDIVADPGEQADLSNVASPLCGKPAKDRVPKLSEELEGALERAAKGQVEEQSVEVDQGEVCRLCALGYMTGPDCDDC